MHQLTRPIAAVFSLTLALLFPVALTAADSEHEHGGDEESPLYQSMEEMGRSMRAINKGLNSADPAATKADTLAALQKMQELAIAGKALVPSTIEKLPEAERPAKLSAFRTDLAAAIVTMLELERAVLADNWDLAKETYGKLRTVRKEGHEKYNPEEEE